MKLFDHLVIWVWFLLLAFSLHNRFNSIIELLEQKKACVEETKLLTKEDLQEVLKYPINTPLMKDYLRQRNKPFKLWDGNEIIITPNDIVIGVPNVVVEPMN